jgi:excisionase family DNA binding protein
MTVDPLHPTQPAQLLSIDEVMERLGVGRNTVFNLMGSGRLRSVKLGRRRMISEQAIRDFIASIDQAGD